MPKQRKNKLPTITQSDSDTLETRLRLGLGYDPIYELVELSKSDDITPTQRITIAKILLEYTHPKKKATPDNGPGDVLDFRIILEGSEEAASLKQEIKDQMDAINSED